MECVAGIKFRKPKDMERGGIKNPASLRNILPERDSKLGITGLIIRCFSQPSYLENIFFFVSIYDVACDYNERGNVL